MDRKGHIDEEEDDDDDDDDDVDDDKGLCRSQYYILLRGCIREKRPRSGRRGLLQLMA